MDRRTNEGSVFFMWENDLAYIYVFSFYAYSFLFCGFEKFSLYFRTTATNQQNACLVPTLPCLCFENTYRVIWIPLIHHSAHLKQLFCYRTPIIYFISKQPLTAEFIFYFVKLLAINSSAEATELKTYKRIETKKACSRGHKWGGNQFEIFVHERTKPCNLTPE